MVSFRMDRWVFRLKPDGHLQGVGWSETTFDGRVSAKRTLNLVSIKLIFINMVNNDHIKLSEKYQPSGCVWAENTAKCPLRRHPIWRSIQLKWPDMGKRDGHTVWLPSSMWSRTAYLIQNRPLWSPSWSSKDHRGFSIWDRQFLNFRTVLFARVEAF